MTQVNRLAGITSSFVATDRLRTHLLTCGDPAGEPVLFVHGNFSSSSYFEALMLAMPERFYCIAVDLRGYGLTENKVIDATRGAGDWAEDLLATLQALQLPSVHLVGWSAGAAAISQFTIDHPQQVKSLTLIAPVSPFGFGGTRGSEGTLCYADGSGSGGGLVPAEFIQRLQAQDRSEDSLLSPRNVIRNSFFSRPRQLPNEELLLTSSLMQKTGPQRYPGDHQVTDNWPYMAPGRYGPLNALSPTYYNVSNMAELADKPPVLWVRGDSDLVVSDRSLSDLAVQGELGLIEGWPGNERFPAQPMVAQTRWLMQRYCERGGQFREAVMAGVGHSPFIEDQALFLDIFLDFLG